MPAPSLQNKENMLKLVHKFINSDSETDRAKYKNAMKNILIDHDRNIENGTADNFVYMNSDGRGGFKEVTLAQYFTIYYSLHQDMNVIELMLEFGADAKKIEPTSDEVKKFLTEYIESQSNEDSNVIQESSVVEKAVIRDVDHRSMFVLIDKYSLELLKSPVKAREVLDEITSLLDGADLDHFTADDFKNLDGDRSETALLAAAKLHKPTLNMIHLMSLFIRYGAKPDVVKNTEGLNVDVYCLLDVYGNNIEENRNIAINTDYDSNIINNNNNDSSNSSYVNTNYGSNNNNNNNNNSSSSTVNTNYDSNNNNNNNNSSSSSTVNTNYDSNNNNNNNNNSSSSTVNYSNNNKDTIVPRSAPIRKEKRGLPWSNNVIGLYAQSGILFIGGATILFYAFEMSNIGAAIGVGLAGVVVTLVAGAVHQVAKQNRKQELENAKHEQKNAKFELSHPQQSEPTYWPSNNNDQINNYWQSNKQSYVGTDKVTTMYDQINIISAGNNTASNNSNNNNNNNNNNNSFTFGSYQ